LSINKKKYKKQMNGKIDHDLGWPSGFSCHKGMNSEFVLVRQGDETEQVCEAGGLWPRGGHDLLFWPVCDTR
jgi:hypothetical protein